MDLASVPEIGPELLDLLDQPTTLARRSEARQTVLNWGHTLRVARTIFAPCQGGLAVRDHPSLEQHRRVVRYAFGAGPVSLRRIPMRLFGFNYCRRCLDPPIPEAPATADESHAALCAVRLGEWMPTWIPTHMYCQKCRNLNAPRPPPAPVPAPPHNKLCIVRTQYGFDRLQYDRYNYYEYRCDVKECAVHARPCPVHSSSPCRFCPRCQCREGCRERDQAQGARASRERPGVDGRQCLPQGQESKARAPRFQIDGLVLLSPRLNQNVGGEPTALERRQWSLHPA